MILFTEFNGTHMAGNDRVTLNEQQDCACVSVCPCVCLCVYTCAYMFLIFTSFGFILILANAVTSLSVSFPVLSHRLLPHLISPPLDPGTLAGNQRLQQVIQAADPLEIQADVHWTHIREREEEERMAPASESSASRGKRSQPAAPLACCLCRHRGPFCQDRASCEVTHGSRAHPALLLSVVTPALLI